MRLVGRYLLGNVTYINYKKSSSTDPQRIPLRHFMIWETAKLTHPQKSIVWVWSEPISWQWSDTWAYWWNIYGWSYRKLLRSHGIWHQHSPCGQRWLSTAVSRLAIQKWLFLKPCFCSKKKLMDGKYSRRSSYTRESIIQRFTALASFDNRYNVRRLAIFWYHSFS